MRDAICVAEEIDQPRGLVSDHLVRYTVLLFVRIDADKLGLRIADEQHGGGRNALTLDGELAALGRCRHAKRHANGARASAVNSRDARV